MSIPVQTVLKTFRRRLTNLSSRNRSLVLSSLPTNQFTDLHDADFRLDQPSFDLVVGLIGRKPHVPICALTDPRDERTNLLSKRLRQLARTERFIRDERGTDDLYVGWPFVRGRFQDGTPVHGPLLFFPVHLTADDHHWRLSRRSDVPVQLNQSMSLAYSHFTGLRLSDDWLNPDFGDFDKDPLTFRIQLYDWLKSSPFQINFNTRNFTNQLQPFDAQSVKSLLQLEKQGELILMPEAVLGIFPQAGSFLVPDYDQLLANQDRNEQAGAVQAEPAQIGSIQTGSIQTGFDLFERFIAPAAGTPDVPIREESLLLPLPVDASQEAAVRAVKAGQSVVVQGPPGTGKSQLITNLMADAAAQGKRVLLVCQKRAALDVVHQRLTQVGMAPFSALVHDFQTDRKPLYDQLAAQIDAVDPYRQQNKSLDAVLLDREFSQASRRIDALVGTLQTFKDALFDRSVSGVSVKELYLSSQPDVPGPSFADLYRSFRLDAVQPFREKLSRYLAYRIRIGPDHPFADRVSFARFTGHDLMQLRQTIDAVAGQLPPLLDRAEDLFGQPASWATLTSQYVPHRNDLDPSALPVTDPLVWAVLTRLANRTLPDTAGAAFRQDLAGLQLLDEKGLLQTTDDTNLPHRLDQGVAARQSLVGWLFYRDKPFLNRLAQQHELSTSLADLQTLLDRWQHRQAWLAQAETLYQRFTGASLAGQTPDVVRPLLQALERAVATAEASWKTLRTRFPPLADALLTEPSAQLFGQRLADARRLLTDMATAQPRWQTYLTLAQLRSLETTPTEYAAALQTALRQDADNLIEMDRLWMAFTNPERTAASRVSSVAMFDNALYLAWIDAIEQQYPDLRSVSSLEMAQNEAHLQGCIRQKQTLTHAILGLKLREQTYQSLLINRLQNVVSYRELRHQVTKKRSIWPIRRLMEHYTDDVFRLVPCWLASPESVSTLFPMQEGLFDLVIFDEASQCFAENGLPAMLRGKQVVITGDSKQLRPSDLYRARFDSVEAEDADAADAALLEVESLLDLAAHYLPQVSLTGHYRSRSLDLIAFSNDHFYKNALTLLPDFQDINQRVPGIRYHHVPGQWIDQTNPIEADAVVALVKQLPIELPGRSIGVVTFNYPQQQLIQDRLDSQFGPTGEESAVRFVKNIENVQGDECDVIIFSVGYAPDERGRLSAQFGSLSTVGGENRLNVAITRARERTYVITSLYPNQLPVESATNEGPRLLKAYLHYALTVSRGEFRPQPRPVAGLPVAGLLKQRLSATYPDWQPELPFADLTIREGNRYAGLVLTDDDQYFQQTPKDAHAYRPFALTDRHWPVRRRWSRDVWKEGQGSGKSPTE